MRLIDKNEWARSFNDADPSVLAEALSIKCHKLWFPQEQIENATKNDFYILMFNMSENNMKHMIVIHKLSKIHPHTIDCYLIPSSSVKKTINKMRRVSKLKVFA